MIVHRLNIVLIVESVIQGMMSLMLNIVTMSMLTLMWVVVFVSDLPVMDWLVSSGVMSSGVMNRFIIISLANRLVMSHNWMNFLVQ